MGRSPHLHARGAGGELLLGQQAVLHREQARRRAARGVDLRVDVLDVVAGGLRRDHEPRGDLLVRQPRASSRSTSTSRGGEPGRPLAAARHAVARGAEHGLDRLAVEAAGLDLGAQLRRRVVGRRARRGTAAARASPGRRRPRRGCAPGARSRRPTARAGSPEPSSRSRCCTAIAPSGASAADWCSMRSVRYGCMRTRSHSPAPSGPRLSQIAFDTPSRPKSCTSPARRSVRTSPSGEPELRRRPPRRARRPRASGRACTATSGRRSSRSPRAPRRTARPRARRASAGSASITASQVPTASRPSRIASGVGADERGERRVELLARALAARAPSPRRRRRRGARPRRTRRAARSAPRSGRPRPASPPGQPCPSHCS